MTRLFWPAYRAAPLTSAHKRNRNGKSEDRHLTKWRVYLSLGGRGTAVWPRTSLLPVGSHFGCLLIGIPSVQMLALPKMLNMISAGLRLKAEPKVPGPFFLVIVIGWDLLLCSSRPTSANYTCFSTLITRMEQRMESNRRMCGKCWVNLWMQLDSQDTRLPTMLSGPSTVCLFKIVSNS